MEIYKKYLNESSFFGIIKGKTAKEIVKKLEKNPSKWKIEDWGIVFKDDFILEWKSRHYGHVLAFFHNAMDEPIKLKLKLKKVTDYGDELIDEFDEADSKYIMKNIVRIKKHKKNF